MGFFDELNPKPTYDVAAPGTPSAPSSDGPAGVPTGKRNFLPVRAATTGSNISLSDPPAITSIDGWLLAVNDLILLKDQSLPAQNGPYKVLSISPVLKLERARDCDTLEEITATMVYVAGGLANQGTIHYVQGIDPRTSVLGTVPLVYQQISGTRVDANSGGMAYTVSKTIAASGAGGAYVDVPLLLSVGPALKIVDSSIVVKTASGAGLTATLRTATAGGGTALSDSWSTATTGVKRDASLATPPVIPAGGSMYLHLDNAVDAEIRYSILRQ